MILVTYLPFYRVHEVIEYFDKNVQTVKPSKAMVYVDNVFNPKQIEILRSIVPPHIELRTGNWRSRSGTWFTMLKDLQGLGEVAIMDSDNLLDDSFIEANSRMGYDMYTVLDREAWSRGAPNVMARSREAGEIEVKGQKVKVYAYRIYEPSLRRKGTVLFIGPKQVVVYRKLPELTLIEKVEQAFMDVPAEFRGFINDEGVLGILAYLSGIRETPWIVLSTHMHHGSEHPASGRRRAIVASAQLSFAKSLRKRFNDGAFRAFERKYTLSLIKDVIYLF
ncbi:MAG: hypothetical protein JRN01_08110 [Nitrososphaerota archaeon]|nr:hypothetical protein [Nitrososphaerota archaeon]